MLSRKTPRALLAGCVIVILCASAAPAQVSPDFQQNLNRVDQLLLLNKFDEAVTLAEQLQKRYGDSSELLSRLKQAYLGAKRYADLITLLDREVARNPQDQETLAQLASIYLKAGEKPKAEQTVKKLIALAPAEASVYSRAAGVYTENGYAREAIDWYGAGRKALGNPRAFSWEVASLFEALRDYPAALREYFTQIDLEPTDAGLEARVTQLVNQVEADSSIERTLAEFTRWPGRPARGGEVPQPAGRVLAYRLYGDMLYNRGEIRLAVEEYRSADQYGGTRGTNLLRLILKLLADGYYAVADSACQALIAQIPNDPLVMQALLLQAQARTGEKRYASAGDIYRQVVETTPLPREKAEALLAIALLHLEALNQPAVAQAEFQSLVTNYPDLSLAQEARLRLGDCLLAQDKLDEALRYFQDFSRETNSAILGERLALRLAELFFYRGQVDSAADAYRLIVERYPRSTAVNDALNRLALLAFSGLAASPELSLFSRAEKLRTQRQFEKAIALYEKLADAGWQIDQVLWAQALALRAAGEYPKALVALAKLKTERLTSRWAACALKLSGEIRLEDLGDPAGARAAFEEILKNYPDAIFTEEVRTRLKRLPPGSGGAESLRGGS